MALGKKDTLAKYLPSILLVIACMVFVGLAFARIATFAYEVNPDDFMMGFAASVGGLGPELAARPLHIDWSCQWAKNGAFIGALAVFVLAIISMSNGMKFKNEDTEGSHGKDRMATPSEMGMFLDKKLPYNNAMYSERSGIVINPYDKKTRFAQSEKNLNMLVIGVSGLGKTYNYVYPLLMAACGTALIPLPYGLRNAAKILHSAEETKAAQAARKNTWKQPPKDCQFVADGFDIFGTDTKGDSVRDCANMLLAAGFDLRVFNTLELLESMSYNPFDGRYIKTHLVDIKEAAMTWAKINCYFSPITAVANRKTISASPAYSDNQMKFTVSPRTSEHEATERHTKRTVGSVSTSFTLDTTVSSLEDIEEFDPTIENLEALDAMLKQMDRSDPTYVDLQTKRDLLWMRVGMGDYIHTNEEGKPELVSGTTIKGKRKYFNKIADAVKATKYQRSTGKLVVEYKSVSPADGSCKVAIELDPALVIRSCRCSEDTDISYNADGSVIHWNLGTPDPQKPLQPGDIDTTTIYRLEIDVFVEPMRVPDGIALTKTIDTLCANLRTNEAPSSGDADFWEGCKRLLFMGIVSLQFERFHEHQRNIPTMIRLLNLAIPERGADADTKTPLGIMMEEWEKGEVIEHVSAPSASGRGRVLTTKVTKSSTRPHDRSISLALNCYYSIEGSAEDTFRSVLISCKEALKNCLDASLMGKLLEKDEMHLERLGDPGQKSAIFCIISDLDNPLEFVTAMMVQQAIDLNQQKAYQKYQGKLPRQVRFILDEVGNIGKIPVLPRALAVVRSRNIAISLFFQSKDQISKTYGKDDAAIIQDNCSSLIFLGSQNNETLKMISERIGEETVASRTFQRSFGSGVTTASTNENIGLTARKIMSVGEVRSLARGLVLVFITGLPGAVLDRKIQTSKHPMYPYICVENERPLFAPVPMFDEPFSIKNYVRTRQYATVKAHGAAPVFSATTTWEEV